MTNLLLPMSNGFDLFTNLSVDLKFLQDHMPLIFNLLVKCGSPDKSLHLLFRDLVGKSLSLFQDNGGHCRSVHSLKPCEDSCLVTFLACCRKAFMYQMTKTHICRIVSKVENPRNVILHSFQYYLLYSVLMVSHKCNLPPNDRFIKKIIKVHDA
jgi:hypothetical protein